MRNRFVWLLLSLFMLSFVGATRAPAIVMQPQSATVLVGHTTKLSVSAVGEELTYQWQKNGAPIAGATTAELEIASPALTDGAAFQVTVTNDKGTVESCIALLTVIESGTESTSAPICPEHATNEPTGGTGGGCGGGGGGSSSGGSSSGGDVGPNDPAQWELPDYLRPYPFTRWKGTIKVTHVYSTGDGSITGVLEGDVTFESNRNEIGLHPTTLTAVEGSFTFKRDGVGGGCADHVDATGTINHGGPGDVSGGQLTFTPYPERPQHATELRYNGGGTVALVGTQERRCPSFTSNAWTHHMPWIQVVDATTSPDLITIDGTYAYDSGPGNSLSFEWHLVKQR